MYITDSPKKAEDVLKFHYHVTTVGARCKRVGRSFHQSEYPVSKSTFKTKRRSPVGLPDQSQTACSVSHLAAAATPHAEIRCICHSWQPTLTSDASVITDNWRWYAIWGRRTFHPREALLQTRADLQLPEKKQQKATTSPNDAIRNAWIKTVLRATALAMSQQTTNFGLCSFCTTQLNQSLYNYCSFNAGSTTTATISICQNLEGPWSD